jgi:hypothetical protein
MGKNNTNSFNNFQAPGTKKRAYQPYPQSRPPPRAVPQLRVLPDNNAFKRAFNSILTCPIRYKELSNALPQTENLPKNNKKLLPTPPSSPSNCTPPLVTPYCPDPPIMASPLFIDLLGARPQNLELFEYRDIPDDIHERLLSFDSPPDLPKVISYRIDSWKPPRNGFPPWIRFENGHPNWNDCDVHTALFFLENGSASPSLFVKTFMDIFSIPGLSTSMAALDLREGFFDKRDWLVNKSAGQQCLISPDWGSFRHRRLLRFLMNECSWTLEEIQLYVEPYVARKLGPYFWNPVCNKTKRFKAPPEGSLFRDWFDYPQNRSPHPTLPFELSQSFAVFL